jgi:hypothetical protein
MAVNKSVSDKADAVVRAPPCTCANGATFANSHPNLSIQAPLRWVGVRTQTTQRPAGKGGSGRVVRVRSVGFRDRRRSLAARLTLDYPPEPHSGENACKWAKEANTHLTSQPSSGALNGALTRTPPPHRAYPSCRGMRETRRDRARLPIHSWGSFGGTVSRRNPFTQADLGSHHEALRG